MEYIQLQHILPQIFAEKNEIHSDIWHKDFTFHKGKYYLIEAASGTGKSSLCSYLYGERSDYQGIISFDKQNIRSFSTPQWASLRKNSLAILFQDLRLFPELTAWENVQIKNKLTRYKNKKDILDLFQMLNISDKLHTPINKLSFGQQQRVAFIRTLCQPFDFILLDEPVSHLDIDNNHLIRDILQKEAIQRGAGIIVTSIGQHLQLNYNRILML